jgi:hypothetical protein
MNCRISIYNRRFTFGGVNQRLKTRSFVTLLAVCAALGVSIDSAHASSRISAKGANGEIISIATNKVKSGSTIFVEGRRFDETVGIYLAYCVMPSKGEVPTPCGGGENKTGIGDASYWISSNPPPYGKGLAIPFKPGGRFREKLLISKKIGNFDCTKIKCAVTVRADHLLSADRSYDLFLPISIK